MPRHTYKPTERYHSGQLAYFSYRRKNRAELRKQEIRIARRNEVLDARLAYKLERRQTVVYQLKKKIDRLEKYPSKNAAKLLREIIKCRNTPADLRARASAILLRWTDGDFSHGRRKRRAG